MPRQRVFRPSFVTIALATVLSLLSHQAAQAQIPTLTTLHRFSASYASNPSTALILGRDGNFYGTSASGGTNNLGTVFQLTPAGVLTVLHSFSVGEGNDPSTALVQGTDGNFYGATLSGGANGVGTIFQCTPAGVLTVLHTLVLSSNGANPDVTTLVQGADGNLYGTTNQDGSQSGGTFFQLTLAGGYTALYSFGAGNEGRYPSSLIPNSDGSFYGTTSDGTSTFFQITSAGVPTILHYFTSDEGDQVTALIRGNDGNFYGTTSSSGVNQYGAIFKCTPTGTVKVLVPFPVYNGYFEDTPALVEDGSGNLYGVLPNYGIFAQGGGTTSYGGIFQCTPAGALTILHTFNGSDGSNPQGGLVLGRNGNFYGITEEGGANQSYGTVFSVTPAGSLSTLYTFAGGEGSHPSAGLAVGPDGDLYGTAEQGGTYGDGAVFSITPTGALTILHEFAGASGGDGSSPAGALLVGHDGNLYGTAAGGGTGGRGEVFRYVPGGSFDAIYDFTAADNSGGYPLAGLVEDNSGNFYGTTSGDNPLAGNPENAGSAVFRLDATGNFSLLASFYEGGSTGSAIFAPVVLGTDGNLYGTTSAGGTDYYGAGTVFRLTLTGGLTSLHSFIDSDGSMPYAGLVEGTDGNFYGTTEGGGTNGVGTVFSITPAGVLTTLHSFAAATDGSYPQSGLTLGDDGNFYGTASGGGSGGDGTLYSITPAGTLTVLHDFTGTDGTNPGGGLVEKDGNFYGTTADTRSGYGTVFRLNLHGVLGFGAAAYTVNEDAGSVTLTVSRAGSPAGAVSAAFSTVDGTAVAGVDYTATSGTLTWADGDVTSRPIVVPVADRRLSGGLTSSFNVVLSGPTGGAALGIPPTGSVTIVENDAVPTPTPAPTPTSTPTPTPTPVAPTVTIVVAGSGEAIAGGGAAKAFVQRTGDTSTALTVRYKVAGSAQSGVEYKPVSDTVTIPAGATKVKIKIKPIINPTLNGKFVAKIKLKVSATGSYILGSPDVAKIEVIDDL